MGSKKIKIPKMGDKSRPHQYQWDHTENALQYWAMQVTKLIEYHKESLEYFFLENECYATEKYDGTNVAKDDRGQVYSRRLLIDDDEEKFIETSLTKVRESNVEDFRNRLEEVACLDESVLARCVVYGELLCNKYYDYVGRGIVGDWKEFGAGLLVKRDPDQILDKLIKAGFAAAIKSSNKHMIQLFINEKFVEVAKHVKLDVPEKKGNNTTIAKVIEESKDAMKKGQLEGMVFTIYDNGYKVFKWKAAQEYQPVAVEKLIIANEKVQKENIKVELKTTFGYIHEVATDISENKSAIKLMKKKKQKSEKESTKEKVKGNKYLSNLDKEMIQHGILHSQNKFDALKEYVKKNEIEEYKSILVTEVKKHYAEEKGEIEEIDENIATFITHKVNSVIKGQLSSLEKESKKQSD